MFLKKKKKLKCTYASLNECPYENRNGCNKHNKNCPHDTQTKKKKKYYKYTNIIWAFLVAIIILCIYKYIDTISKNEEYNIRDFFSTQFFLNILFGIAISIIAGAIVAIIIDLPNRLKEYENSFISALSSNNYLKKLDEDKLTKLRMEITDLLHKKDVPNMPKGVIELDQKICSLLKEPYFKIYRQTTKCKLISRNTNGEDKVYILKENTINYVIHNPYDKDHAVSVDIGLGNQVLQEENVPLRDYFSMSEWTIRIDDYNKPIDLMKEINRGTIAIGSCNLSKENTTYNKKVFLFIKGNKDKLSLDDFYDDSTQESDQASANNSEAQDIQENMDPTLDRLLVTFCDKITVNMKYCTIVPTNDLLYTKRLRYPVKYFRLDYSFDHEDSNLIGQLIGTLIDQSKISTNVSDDGKHISIETFDWLLPKNGVVIAMASKKNSFVQQNI